MSRLARLLSVIVGGFVIAVLYANCNNNSGVVTGDSRLPGQDGNATLVVAPLPTGSGQLERLDLTAFVRRHMFAELSDSEWDESQFKLIKTPVGAEVYSDDAATLPRATADGGNWRKADSEFDKLFVKLPAAGNTVDIELKRPADASDAKTLKLVVVEKIEKQTSASTKYIVSGPKVVQAGAKALFVVQQKGGDKGSFAGSFGIEQGGVKGVYHSTCCAKTEGNLCKNKVTTRPVYNSVGEPTGTEAVDFCLSLPGPSGDGEDQWDWLPHPTQRDKVLPYYNEDQSLPVPHYAVVDVLSADAGQGFNVALKASTAQSPTKLANVRAHSNLSSTYKVSVQRQMCDADMTEADCQRTGGSYSSNSCNCDNATRAVTEALVLTWPCPADANSVRKNDDEKCSDAVSSMPSDAADTFVKNYQLKRCQVGQHSDDVNCEDDDNYALWSPSTGGGGNTGGWGASGTSFSNRDVIAAASSAGNRCVYIGSTQDHNKYFDRYINRISSANNGEFNCAGFPASGDAVTALSSTRHASGKFIAVVLPLDNADKGLKSSERGFKYKYRVVAKAKDDDNDEELGPMACSGTSDVYGEGAMARASCLQDQIRVPKNNPQSVRVQVVKERASNKGAIQLSWQGFTSVAPTDAGVDHSYKIQVCQKVNKNDSCNGDDWHNLRSVGSGNAAFQACSKVKASAVENEVARVASPCTNTNGADCFSCVLAGDGTADGGGSDEFLEQDQYYRFRIYDANKVGTTGQHGAGAGESSGWVYATDTMATASDAANGDPLMPGFDHSIGQVQVKKVAAVTADATATPPVVASPAQIQLSWPCPAAANRDWEDGDNVAPADRDDGTLLSGDEDNNEPNKVAYYKVEFCGGATADVTACKNNFDRVPDQGDNQKRWSSRSVSVDGTGSDCTVKFEASAAPTMPPASNVAGVSATGAKIKAGDKYVFRVTAYSEIDVVSVAMPICSGPVSIPSGPQDSPVNCTSASGDAGVGLP